MSRAWTPCRWLGDQVLMQQACRLTCACCGQIHHCVKHQSRTREHPLTSRFRSRLAGSPRLTPASPHCLAPLSHLTIKYRSDRSKTWSTSSRASIADSAQAVCSRREQRAVRRCATALTRHHGEWRDAWTRIRQGEGRACGELCRPRPNHEHFRFSGTCDSFAETGAWP